MDKKGFFVISLDFELLWGVFDVVDFRKKEEYFRKTRQVVPGILELFSKYDVHATWAVVGMLFNRDWEEWKKNFPKNLPHYNNSTLSAYAFGEHNSAEVSEEIVFAPEIIQNLKKIRGQEIATHTYSHYYCLEQGQTPLDFKADLEKTLELSQKAGIQIKSLVFPRNQLKKEYLEICKELGIQNVRSNPSSWYWKDTLSEAFLTKAARSGDAYLPFGKKSYSIKVPNPSDPIEQMASRFLRPVEENSILRKFKLERIEQEMKVAAKKNEVYHLWWHPHNFGGKPEESLKDLERILKYFDHLREKYGFQSHNMAEVGDILRFQKVERKH